MSDVIFYEKPGCIGNQQQKILLSSQGCLLDVRDLLSEPWTATRLRPFFADKPVREWFNLSAPRVKSGQLDIQGLDEQQAIALMLDTPSIIKRPLLDTGSQRHVGFKPEQYAQIFEE